MANVNIIDRADYRDEMMSHLSLKPRETAIVSSVARLGQPRAPIGSYSLRGLRDQLALLWTAQ